MQQAPARPGGARISTKTGKTCITVFSNHHAPNYA